MLRPCAPPKAEKGDFWSFLGNVFSDRSWEFLDGLPYIGHCRSCPECPDRVTNAIEACGAHMHARRATVCAPSSANARGEQYAAVCASSGILGPLLAFYSCLLY